MAQVAFQQCYFRITAIQRNGQECGRMLGGIERSDVIGILESHRERLFRVGGISQPSFLGGMEIIMGNLVLDDGFALLSGIETIGNTLIVSPDDDTKTAFYAQIQLIAHGFIFSLPVKWCLNGFFYGLCYAKPQIPVRANLFSVNQNKADGRRSHQHPSVQLNGNGERIALFQDSCQPTVGRSDREGICPSRSQAKP